MGDILSQPFVAIILLLGILIFVHELGHFIVGKLCGIGVEVFSIGIGPTLISFTYKKTLYQLALFPFGGFVKFAGAHSSEPVSEHFAGKEMLSAPSWARALTLIAGPFANFFLAIAVFSWMGATGIPHAPAIIGQVMPQSAAEEAGMRSGDNILSIDGQQISTWEQFREIVSSSAGKKLIVQVERGHQALDLALIPKAAEARSLFGQKTQVGRAGIGLGLVPPVISLVGQSSYAAQMGFQTGDRILKVLIPSEEPALVNSWPIYSELIFQSLKSGHKSVVILLERQEQQQEITLNLEPFLEQKKLISSLEAFESAIGWTHSALSIQDVQPPSSDLLQPNDRLLEAAATPLRNVYDLSEVLQKNTSSSLPLLVERAGKQLLLEVPLAEEEVQKPQGKEKIYVLKIKFLASLVQPEPYIERYSSFFAAFFYGIKRTAEESWTILTTLGGLITGSVPVQVLGGPIMIAQVAKNAASEGVFSFFLAMALISINLGVLNLVPIPFLDGGQLLLIGIQGLRRKQLSEMAIENFHKVGFVMVLALMILATYNDLNRFWASMIKSMIGFFDK